jgi:hypothetical protein
VAGSARTGAKPGSRLVGRSLGAAAVAGVLLSAVSGCGSGSSSASDSPVPDQEVAELLVSVDDEVSEGASLSADDVEASGPGDPEVTLVREHGGELRAERAEDGSAALRFPAHEAGLRAPVAILSLTSPDKDWLQPGDDDLVFGADLAVDAVSDGTARDNGDNVVQRGLFGAPAQFKLQVDHRRPSCLVRGDAGMVLAKSSVTLEPATWYRVTCRRAGDEVEVTVSRLEQGAPVDTEVDSESGDIGTVSFPSGTFVSIGGKLGPDGGPVEDATDQYDGSLRQIHVSTGDTATGSTSG